MTTPPRDLSLPENLPMINCGSVLGRGWRGVEEGQVLKTTYQFYSLSEPMGWRLSEYRFTSDGLKHRGTVSYRAPVSLMAWMQVLPRLPLKYLRRWWRRLNAQSL